MTATAYFNSDNLTEKIKKSQNNHSFIIPNFHPSIHVLYPLSAALRVTGVCWSLSQLSLIKKKQQTRCECKRRIRPGDINLALSQLSDFVSSRVSNYNLNWSRIKRRVLVELKRFWTWNWTTSTLLTFFG